ncbi:putative mitochondrial protein, conserved [Orbilia javanica]|uniref:Succinate dehydrogenase assembly factor 4, mitochondrial n=1 Tax=Orbilia javanica TaxID=47235 RepID=A0AAN8RID9_9PEZI
MHRLLPLTRRHFTTHPPLKTSFKPSPSPPRLPKADQETFESLTKASMGSFSTSHLHKNSEGSEQKEAKEMTPEALLAELTHKDLLTGGEKPLFEGDRNPVTGEVGGPKTEPTKYGDWSFNGRVTDF